MKQHQTGGLNQTFLLFAGLLTLFMVVSLACNLVELRSIRIGSGAELSSFVGSDGGIAIGPGDVKLIVPEGAFTQPTKISIEEVATVPSLPKELDIAIAGKPVEITIFAQAEADAVFELVLPLEREEGVPDDQYSVLRWDGTRWTTAGGFVSGDNIRVWTNQFSIFLPTRSGWIHRPVSFVNDGPYNATVMPWTYEPFDPASVLPPGLSTVSFAPGNPGVWPNPSRFLTLPLGLYTFCIEWDEDQDLDNDGYIDIYHDILEGPSADLPFSVDENASINIAFAKELRFRTDPIDKLEGGCGGVLGASPDSTPAGYNPTQLAATHVPLSSSTPGQEAEVSSTPAEGGSPTQPAITDVPQPSSTPDQEAEVTETDIPTEIPPKMVWVLTETLVNPREAQLEYRGGPSIPGWFDEDRFEGKFLIYSVTETSFRIDDRHMDHGYEEHNVSIETSFDAPPQTLIPEETIELVANFSHSGTVQNGVGIGILFWYSSENNSMQPDFPFSYSPWYPDFMGTDTTTFSFVVPKIVTEGSEIEVAASLWNNPPCLIIWKYQAQEAR